MSGEAVFARHAGRISGEVGRVHAELRGAAHGMTAHRPMLPLRPAPAGQHGHVHDAAHLAAAARRRRCMRRETAPGGGALGLSGRGEGMSAGST